MNRPWPRWFAVTLTVLSFAVRASSRAAEHQDSLDKAFRLVREAVEKDEVPGAIALVARGGDDPIGGPLDDFWLAQKPPDIVQSIARSQLRFKPGSKFEYSNSALFVLGRVIEVVSGRPYAAYVKETVLQPLGMSDTHYAPPAAEANRIATIYARRDGKRETVFRFNPAVKIVNTAPDGGLFSCPAQFAPFLQMFLENDGRVLSRSAVAEMLREQAPGWGLGWSLPDGLFQHEGSSGTLAWADPKTRVIGILFLQFRDQKEADVRLRKGFREAVQKAFANRP